MKGLGSCSWIRSLSYALCLHRNILSAAAATGTTSGNACSIGSSAAFQPSFIARRAPPTRTSRTSTSNMAMSTTTTTTSSTTPSSTSHSHSHSHSQKTPWYSDASVNRDRSLVLSNENEADWESIKSPQSRFVLITSQGMHYVLHKNNTDINGKKEKEEKDQESFPLYLTYEQITSLLGSEAEKQLKEASMSSNTDHLLAWAGKSKHDQLHYWVYYQHNHLDIIDTESATTTHNTIIQNPNHNQHVKQSKNMRQFGDSLASSTDAAILATCNGLVEFHRSHAYCSRCGSKTRITKAGGARVCMGNNDPVADTAADTAPAPAVCGGSMAFPRIDVAAIMLITSRCNNYALLGRQARWPQGLYSTLAGFVDIGETMEQCCIRETLEESGVPVDPDTVEFVCSQPWPFPRSLMVGFRAKVAAATAAQDFQDLEEENHEEEEERLPEINIEEEEMQDVQWFSKEYVRARLNRGADALIVDPATKEEQDFHLPGPASLGRLLIVQWANE